MNIASSVATPPPEVVLVERILIHFPDVVSRAVRDYAPHHVVTYLVELASAWNTYYAAQKIVDPNDPYSPYRVALADAVATTLKNGLTLLGISAPERM